ncbi:MAG: hypothetical protein WB341_11965 [Terracidiphilus sp.]
MGSPGCAGPKAALRLCSIVLPAILALSAAVPAQQPSLAGQWRGVYQRITITIVIQANGQYIQTTQSGTMMTQQSGPYRLVSPNAIIFSVTNWAPKTQQIYHPTGTVGGYYTTEVVAKPPGATDTYVFNGPNTIILTDQMAHGSITLTRVQ